MTPGNIAGNCGIVMDRMDETHQTTGPEFNSAGAPPPYEIVAPRSSHRPAGNDFNQTIPFVLNSPHSGAYYPPEFLAASKLDRNAIRRSEDVMVDRLFRPVVDLGAPLLRATYPRAFVDVNREPYELDPKMFSGRLPEFANIRSLRVAGGLGTVPRIVADTQDIYKAPIQVDEAITRINTIYKPYHDALRRLLAKTHVAFGFAILIDCHSMPSSPRSRRTSSARPDFVLGDRYGASCFAEITEIASQALGRLGYTVRNNKPYAGGFITEHYGRPSRGLHALQIEVNRSLYMDECSLQPNEGMARLQEHLLEMMGDLCELAANLNNPQRDAAE